MTGKRRRLVPDVVARLTEERQRQGISQREVGRRMAATGTPPSAASLSDWESGHADPGSAYLERWAAALGLVVRIVGRDQ